MAFSRERRPAKPMITRGALAGVGTPKRPLFRWWSLTRFLKNANSFAMTYKSSVGEMPEERFREVAQQVGYTLQSEANLAAVRSPFARFSGHPAAFENFRGAESLETGVVWLRAKEWVFPSSRKAYKPNELVVGAFPPTWLRAKIAVILATNPNTWISKRAIHDIIRRTNPTRAGLTLKTTCPPTLYV